MKTICIALMLATLAACSQVPQPSTSAATAGDAASTSASAPAAQAATEAAPTVDATLLTRYHWLLMDAADKSGRHIDALFARPDKPLQLDFDAHAVSVSNTCNRMRGSYSLANGKLTVGPLASTLMACNDPTLAALDAAAGKVLQGTFTLELNANRAQPRLTLAASNGDALTFAAEPTAETRYGSAGETMFLEVAPETRPCNHPLRPNAQCLYVRELHYGANGIREGEPGAWEVLGQDIEGYTHEPGVRNVLRVKRYKIANPPADGSTVAYVLDMVVESHAPAHS
ncbi:MAG: META and DUF4377 domain-containing protein [Proteobacteria bacterium]|nr:META and DUF4377 domain-containing protein [Pseudomonadota bacterium]